MGVTETATMITDPLFYRLFETSPETFFLLLKCRQTWWQACDDPGPGH